MALAFNVGDTPDERQRGVRGVPTFPIGGSTVFGQVTGAGDGGDTGGNNNQAHPFTTPVAGGQYEATMPIDPDITQKYADYLRGQVGKGAKPFDLTTWIPGSGKTTQPGQLSAEIDPMLFDLSQFVQDQLYNPGSRIQPVGGATLEEMIKSGMPIDQTPAWEAMTKAMDRTYQKGAGDIRAQMAGLGLVGGSPHEGAQADYALQASREKAGLLGTMQAGALESARGRQIQGLELSKGFYALELDQQKYLIDATNQIGQLFQGMDQAAIDRTFGEFLRTRPEYGPLLNLIQALATTFPQFLSKEVGLGSVGAAIANIGGAAEAGVDIMEIIKGLKGGD